MGACACVNASGYSDIHQTTTAADYNDEQQKAIQKNGKIKPKCHIVRANAHELHACRLDEFVL